MSMEATIKLMVRPDRVAHTIKENRKIQDKYQPKAIPHSNEYRGSIVKVGFGE